jgi:hypothetical protein
MSTTKATPWGQAELVDEIVLWQQVGDSSFSTHVQLLETKLGDRLIRFAYATEAQASVRRGPVTLTLADLKRLRKELGRHPELAAALGLEGATPPQRPAVRGPRRRASRG